MPYAGQFLWLAHLGGVNETSVRTPYVPTVLPTVGSTTLCPYGIAYSRVLRTMLCGVADTSVVSARVNCSVVRVNCYRVNCSRVNCSRVNCSGVRLAHLGGVSAARAMAGFMVQGLGCRV